MESGNVRKWDILRKSDQRVMKMALDTDLLTAEYAFVGTMLYHHLAFKRCKLRGMACVSPVQHCMNTPLHLYPWPDLRLHSLLPSPSEQAPPDLWQFIITCLHSSPLFFIRYTVGLLLPLTSREVLFFFFPFYWCNKIVHNSWICYNMFIRVHNNQHKFYGAFINKDS